MSNGNLMYRVEQVKHVLDLFCESRMAECNEALPALDLCRQELAAISDALEHASVPRGVSPASDTTSQQMTS
jgi:hypothetical protein